MTRSNKATPQWYELGQPLFWELPKFAYETTSSCKDLSQDLATTAVCASIHFIHCLNLSVEANQKGQHAVSIALIRQCVESLGVIEIGVIKNRISSAELLQAWKSDQKTAGALRKSLESIAWPSYGEGIWKESWAEYYGEFCKAVQPFAHYSAPLQGWQLAIEERSATEKDGSIFLLARIGLNTYEGNKATRITLLQCLLIWTMGRILMANLSKFPFRDEVSNLGQALASAKELGRGSVSWAVQFWAHEFDHPNPPLEPNS